MTISVRCFTLIAFAALAIANFGCSRRIPPAVSDFSVQTPKPFGYVIGDLIEQRIQIELRRGVTLLYTSLPSKGPINRWLNLADINIDTSQTQIGRRYDIKLRYQLFYAPLEVKMLTLPSFDLRLKQGVIVTRKTVPAWNFTMSPLRELAVRKQDGETYIRPPALAPLIDTGPPFLKRLVWVLVWTISSALLAYWHGWLPFIGTRKIFSEAGRRLAHLDDNQLEAVLQTMHRAFNELNQGILFKHQLASFFRQHGRYRALRNELEWFFDYSNRYYFAQQQRSDPEAVKKIKALCRACRHLERHP